MKLTLREKAEIVALSGALMFVLLCLLCGVAYLTVKGVAGWR